MAATDTSPDIRRRVAAAFAAMTGPQRVAHAAEMAEEAKTIAFAGIRSRRPDLGDDEVEQEWLRLLHGDDVVDRITECSSSRDVIHTPAQGFAREDRG